MSLKDAVLSLVAGTAALILVGAVVTDLTAPYVEFALFFGFPAGLAVGVVVAAFVYLRLATSIDPAERHPAYVLAGAGAAFVAAVFMALGLGVGNSLVVPLASVVAVVGALVAYVRVPSGDPTGT